MPLPMGIENNGAGRSFVMSSPDNLCIRMNPTAYARMIALSENPVRSFTASDTTVTVPIKHMDRCEDALSSAGVKCGARSYDAGKKYCTYDFQEPVLCKQAIAVFHELFDCDAYVRSEQGGVPYAGHAKWAEPSVTEGDGQPGLDDPPRLGTRVVMDALERLGLTAVDVLSASDNGDSDPIKQIAKFFMSSDTRSVERILRRIADSDV